MPFKVTSETLRVPKPLPVISGAALPPVNPRNVLVTPSVIPIPALVMLVIVPLPLFITGKEALPGGGIKPVIVERLAVAS